MESLHELRNTGVKLVYENTCPEKKTPEPLVCLEQNLGVSANYLNIGHEFC